MWIYPVLSLSILLLIIWSICERMRLLRQKTDTVDAKSSLLSIAIQELVATAGGVYLSLIMLISFLKIEIAGVVEVYNIKVDPVAFFSIGLAICQPIFTRLFFYKKN